MNIESLTSTLAYLQIGYVLADYVRDNPEPDKLRPDDWLGLADALPIEEWSRRIDSEQPHAQARINVLGRREAAREMLRYMQDQAEQHVLECYPDALDSERLELEHEVMAVWLSELTTILHKLVNR